jgi:pyrroline-5-carboxylate reductase
VVCDRNAKKLRQLRRTVGVHPETDLRRAAAQASLLLVAVRPPDVLPLLSKIDVLPFEAVLVSLAAGVPLRALGRALPAHTGAVRNRLARAMPSPACRTGHGLTALAFGRGMPPAARHRVRRFFKRVGEVVEIPEREFDAFTVAYSTSQGLHALGARIRAAQKIGLSRRSAIIAAAHGLVAGLHGVDTVDSLADLLSEAATPGGIAGKVMAVMRAEGYDRAIERAFRAGLARARHVGRM